METIGKLVKQASIQGNLLSTEVKNNVLETLKINLKKNQELIIKENQKDVEKAIENQISAALVDRLTVDESRIDGIIESLDDVIHLQDPIGITLDHSVLDNDLVIDKVSVPLGVVGIIYESRPNVTIDAFALCFKAGNAVILKGGKEAIHTNTILESLVQNSLQEHGLDVHLIHLIKDTSRESTMKLMQLNKYVDVLIPRGSKGLIQAVLTNSTIPVIETGAGNCHMYVEHTADFDEAISIIENAKLQRPGVCNAVESLVIDESIAAEFISKLLEKLPQVSFLGDEKSVALNSKVEKATPDDFYNEFLAPVLSIKIVNGIDEAIEHINEHHTSHSDAILTRDMKQAEKFLNLVDSAAVYVNASTRFTDGFVFGLGAEIGISTQKLHARGPMGLNALTTYKYLIKGEGQIR